MPVLRKLFPALLILALLYGAVLLGERLTRQELTRVADSSTGEAACLMWQPRFLRSGVCSLDLQNARGKVLDTAALGTLPAGFEALQQFGQLGFADRRITVASLKTGELRQSFTVRDGRLVPPE